MTKLIRACVVMACACVAGLSSSAGDPDLWLSQARAAMGGAVAQEAVTSLTIKGSVNRTTPRFSVNSSWELSWQAPDQFVTAESRSQSSPMGTISTTQRNGFSGDRPIHQTISDMPLPPPPYNTPDATVLLRQKQQLARFLVPLLATTAAVSSIHPLTVAPIDPSASSEPGFNVITLTGPDGTAFRVSFDAVTHLPAMVRWMGRPIVMSSVTSTATVSTSGRMPPSMPAPSRPMPMMTGDPTAGMPDVEYQMALTDYKLDKGIRWPRRLTITAGGERYEAFRISGLTANPKISARTFAIGR